MPHEDPIIDEIHKYRREHAAKFNFDVEAIFADMLAKQKELEAQGCKFVDPPPSPSVAPLVEPADAVHSDPTLAN